MWRDVEMARRAGGRSVLVRTGHGRSQERAWPADVAGPTAVCDNLMGAAAVILGA
jgi:phosphoglycolate phosphatase-like HAD superfamily hydrolase